MSLYSWSWMFPESGGTGPAWRLAAILSLLCLLSAWSCTGISAGPPDVDDDDEADAGADNLEAGEDAPSDQAVQHGKAVLVIIDGARYSETLGDSAARFTPHLAALAGEGCAPGPVLNTGVTTTIAGLSVIHTGAWNVWVEDPVTSEVYQASPTHWEYFRKQLSMDATEAYYVLEAMSESSIWKPSRDPDYGEAYWPTILSRGNSDEQVFSSFEQVIRTDQPTFSVLYLADVDGAGHSGGWSTYTAAISQADSIVGQVWDLLQSLPAYEGGTTMFVTSDHGRHDDAHGGFQDHGDGCDGCRQVTFLAVGPDMDPDCVPSSPPRTLADITPTLGRILGYDAHDSQGSVMEEIFR